MNGEGCGQLCAGLALQGFQNGGEFLTNVLQRRQAAFCRSGVSREARTSSGGIGSRSRRKVSFAAYAAPTNSGHPILRERRQPRSKGIVRLHKRSGLQEGQLRGLRRSHKQLCCAQEFSTAAVRNGWRRLWTTACRPCAARLSKVWRNIHHATNRRYNKAPQCGALLAQQRRWDQTLKRKCSTSPSLTM